MTKYLQDNIYDSDSQQGLLQYAFNLLPKPAMIIDEECKVINANQLALHLLNKFERDVIGRDLFEVINLEEIDLQKFNNLFHEADGSTEIFPFRVIVQTGQDIGIHVLAEIRFFKESNRTYFVCVFNDLSENQEYLNELSRYDFQQKELYENANDLIQKVDSDGNIIYVNNKWLDSLGYRKEEVDFLNITDIVRDDHIPQCFTIFNSIKHGNNFENIETVFKHKNGHDIFVEGNLTGYFENGIFKHTLGIYRDTTKRKTVEEIYRIMIRDFPAPIYIVQDNMFRMVNPAFQKITGYTEKELIGKDTLFMVHPDDLSMIKSNITRVNRANKPISREFRMIRKSGEILWMMETVINIPYEGGTATLGTFVDLSERIFVEDALNESKNRYQTIFSNASDSIVIHDFEGKLLEVNNAACKLLKYDRHELLKSNIINFLVPDSSNSVKTYINDVIKNGFAISETDLVTHEGERIPVEVNTRVIDYDRKKSVISIIRDITERKQIESIKELDHKRLSSLVRISQYEPENTIQLISFSFKEILKLTDSQNGYLYLLDMENKEILLNSNDKDIRTSQKDSPITISFSAPETGPVAEAISLMKPVILNSINNISLKEISGINHDTERLMIIPLIRQEEVVAVAVVTNKSSDYRHQDAIYLIAIFDSIWNIFEKQFAEEALRQSENRYRELTDLSQDAIIRLDEHGIVLMANPSACKMFGYTQEEFTGLSIIQTYPEEELGNAMSMLETLKFQKAQRFERIALKKDLYKFPIEASVSPVTQGCFQEVIRDISERKKMEKEIKESERKYRLLVENQTDLVVELNPRGIILFANSAYQSLIGKTSNEIIGTNIFMSIDKQDRKKALSEAVCIQKIPYTGYCEFRIITTNGSRWIDWSNNAVLDANNNITAYTCIGRDVTEIKQAREDLEKANRQLREVDKLKDNLLSIVSHELRTPLTAIKSFTEILLNYDEDEATKKEFLGIISDESDRLTRLINDFLDLSKIQAGRMQWKNEEVLIQSAINSAINIARPLAELSNLKLILNIESDLPAVIADNDRIIQVVTNIIGNAIKFTPENGTITVWSRVEKNNNRSKSSIITSITDTGIGIEPENYGKIFESFGQIGDVLQDRPKGTGLGLPISKKIVEHYGGRLNVESVKGKGTTFTFTLPVNKKVV